MSAVPFKVLFLIVSAFILAACGGGGGGGNDDTPTPPPPPQLDAPSLTAPDAQTFTINASIAELTIANSGGGSLSSCSADGLPSGLNVAISADTSTCLLSGTPSATQKLSSLSISATNSSGSDTVSFNVSVEPGLPQLVAPEALTVLINQALTLDVVNNGGVELTQCEAEGLPQGLAISINDDAASCIISGTPTVEQAATEATLSATNASGTDEVAFSLTIEAPVATEPAPSLQNIDALTLIQNIEFSQAFINDGGVQIASCTAAVLPEGISVDVSNDMTTCVLSGTPITTQAANTFTVIATNIGGTSEATASITVNPPAPEISDINDIVLLQDETINRVLTNSGGVELSSCSADTLPAGLSVEVTEDNTSCIITGAASTLQTATDHTITATNVTGSNDAILNITVEAVVVAEPSPELTDIESLILIQGLSFTQAFENTGGSQLTACTAEELPSGVTLAITNDLTTCVLSGTPESILEQTRFSIVAVNAGGSNSASVDITVNPAAPILAERDTLSLIQNENLNLSLVNDGGSVASCSASELPTGLSVDLSEDNATCVISGAAQNTQTESDVTITAVNVTGTSSVTFGVEVNVPAPDLAVIPALSFTKNTAFEEVLVNNGGGELTNCSASNLPDSITIEATTDASTCLLSGTPLVTELIENITITATNITGQSTQTTSINVSVGAPLLDTQAPLVVVEQSDVLRTITNSGGDELTSCSADILPTGLSVSVSEDTQNCILSGTPTNVQAASDSVITASNASGSSAVTLSITVEALIVNEPAPALANIDALSLVQNTSFTQAFINEGGGQLSSCSADSLPAGISVSVSSDASTCVLSGTPTNTQAQSVSTISATNISGTNTASVTIVVAVAVPQLEPVAGNTLAFTEGESVLETFVNSGGGELTLCSSSTLPDGLAVSVSSDASTCELSGVPTETGDFGEIDVTATNLTGDTTITFFLSIIVSAPNFEDAVALTLIKGQLVEEVFTNNGGGDITECSANDLPEGLNLSITDDNGTCGLVGTPVNVQTSTNYIVTGTNAGGSDQLTLTITTLVEAPNLQPSEGEVFKRDDDFTLTLLNVGGTEFENCDLLAPQGGEIPVGMSVDRTSTGTCEITGNISTPQEVSVIVAAENSTGESQASVSFTIRELTPFITRWDVRPNIDPDSPRSSNTDSADSNARSTAGELTIFTDPEQIYNFTIDWGDGTVNENVTTNITHVYDELDVYVVTISGIYPQPVMGNSFEEDALSNASDRTSLNSSESAKLLAIVQWGEQPWLSMEDAFANTSNLVIEDTEAPDLTNVTDMSFMFSNSGINQDINHWDVSRVENMSGLFSNARDFNQPLDEWITTNVNDMSFMFLAAKRFNQDIDNWDVNSVTNMRLMFANTDDFNQDLNSWQVGNVTTMASMFDTSRAFNGNIFNWDVSKVENMRAMFRSTESFNQDITEWTVSSATNMERMFQFADVFNQDIGAWDVSSVQTMNEMFEDATLFNQDISGWQVGSVTNMSDMLFDTSFSIANYDLLLSTWFTLPLQPNVTLGVDSQFTSIGLAGRQSMIDEFNWTFEDNGLLSAPALILDNTMLTLYTNNEIEFVLTNEGGSPDTCALTSDADTMGLSAQLRGNSCVFIANATVAFEEAEVIISATNGGGTSNLSFNIQVLEETPYITTWQTDNEGVSEDNQIRLQLNPNFDYNFTVDWGDGVVNTNVTESIIHDYESAGEKVISITGTYPASFFGNNSDAKKLKSVNQWGQRMWLSFNQAFRDTNGLVIEDLNNPDLSLVRSMNRTFERALGFNSDIGAWETGSITTMENMFFGASSFNQSLNAWDVSNVESMRQMFRNAFVYNQDMTLWDVSAVQNFQGMFNRAFDFNGDINTWRMLEATTLNTMFNEASTFNRNISEWVMPKVTNMDQMFKDAELFDQNIGGWELESVTSMADMFKGATAFNQDIGGWNVSNVSNFSEMFFQATNFNQNINNWIVTSATNMNNMFREARNFNQPLDLWVPSNVTNMEGMYREADSFNQNINAWNVGNVQNMRNMFLGADVFNQPILDWDVSQVRNMSNMFNNAKAFNQPIGTWEVDNVTNMSAMFSGSGMTFNQDLNGWITSSVTEMAGMFSGNKAFNSPIDQWDVSQVRNMQRMFFDADAFNQPIGGWTTTSLTNMNSMFARNAGFNQAIGGWDVSSVTNMAETFREARAFNQDLSAWTVDNVTNMRRMFFSTNNFNQDLSEWIINSESNVFEMLRGSNLSTENYDALLLAWSQLDLPVDQTFRANSTFSEAAADARQSIIDTFNWTIIDDGLAPPPVPE